MIMKRDVQCVSRSQKVAEAAKLMRDHRIGFVPVCDEQTGAVEGTLTDRDIAVRFVANELAPDTRVEDVMTWEVVSCRPTADVSDAELIMATQQKSRLLCIDEDGTLAGVLSLSDIAAYDDDEQVVQTLCEISQREAKA